MTGATSRDAPGVAADETSPGHHSFPAHEVVLLLGTDADHGLTSAESHRRLAAFGPNALPRPHTGGAVARLVRQLRDPLIYVLLVAGAVTFLIGDGIEAAVILGVVAVNAVIGFIQESNAEAALTSLRSMLQTQARVRRDGRESLVPSADLVPGDVVLIEAGDKVPADARLLDVTEMQVDESALSGESTPVVKDEVVLPHATEVADRANMIYSGTLVTSGNGIGVVVATGSETEVGQIHRLVGAADDLATPLTRKLAHFSRILAVAILGLAAATFAIGILRGEDAAEMFTAAVALAVGAIPEGLPAAVTITLAIGVKRMARRHGVIRRMPAVETLGSTTVICSDKTGTLTENKMTVRAIWTPGGTFSVTGSGYQPRGSITDASGSIADPDAHDALRWSLFAGAGCNDAELVRRDDDWAVLGDPTEGALLVAAEKAGFTEQAVNALLPRITTIPFASDRMYMATLHTDRSGNRIVLCKGAVEFVHGICANAMAADGSIEPLDSASVTVATEAFAALGFRVLATAIGRIDGDTEFTPDALHGALTLTGLHVMQDPPRADAIDAVRRCQRAGIEVKMITGDHVATATAIAREFGILSGDRPGDVLTGAELAALSAGEYPAAVDRASVFARVSAEQKLHLVEGLQALGHIVAMTGDGVNDAPALQQADIGVAMGRDGTEVAKDAADMVLVDDDFATIEAAVEEGRGVFDNLTKFIVWTLPTNLGEGGVILLAIVLGTMLPILPVQILWINMTTAVALGLMLAFEPKESGIMERPPRDPRAPLLTKPLVVRMLLVSALLIGGTWWLFRWERDTGASAEEARTAAVNLFVVVEAFYLFSCRSLTHSAWRLGVFSNPWIIAGVAVQFAGQALITYVPALNAVFQTAPIDIGAWARIFAVAGVAVIAVAVEKRMSRSVVVRDRRRVLQPGPETFATAARSRAPTQPSR